jgi:two-component system, chemotaxis family, CheB/CheR fusion protein
METQEKVAFEHLLEYLRQNRGFDFTGYKRPSLLRRITRRIESLGMDSIEKYRDYLEVHPNEFLLLFNSILINVTSFFRDPEVWQHLANTIVPEILDAKAPHESIRVWSAGCSSGEEAFTIAMIFAERMGTVEFCNRVKIYATDADEEALIEARAAAYKPERLEGLSPHLVEKYFTKAGERYQLDKDLRRCVIFGRHDLVQDAPISKVDLLTCRNVLIYLNSEVQAKIAGRLHFALNPNGYLLLGKAETLVSQSSLFSPVEVKHRIFRKAGLERNERRVELVAPAPADYSRNGVQELAEAAFEIAPIAQIVVDGEGNLSMANGRARQLFNVAARQIGKPLRDLEVSYRPTDLRSLIDEVRLSKRELVIDSLEWTPSGSQSYSLKVRALPLPDIRGAGVAVSIQFEDRTEVRRLERDLLEFNQELETAYEELQTTNEELQSANEELQSTNEELETTNEELQSTNEELETMNEELQSTNEELQTLHMAAQDRENELRRANVLLNSILASLPQAVIAVDKDMRVLVWSQNAFELWGLRQDEVLGEHLLNLDIAVTGDQLRALSKTVDREWEGAADATTIKTLNRRGKEIDLEVRVTSLDGGDGVPPGVILLMEHV